MSFGITASSFVDIIGGIVQQNSGTIQGSSFTVSLPTDSQSGSTVAIFVAANTTVSTPVGVTLRQSEVSSMGHYLFTTPGGSGSWNFTCPSGSVTWWAVEISNSTFDTAVSSNNSTGGTTYTTPSIDPDEGSKLILASIGSLRSTVQVATASNWTNSFVELADICQPTQDYPMQAIANRTLNVLTGETFSTGATYSVTSSGRSAIIASFSLGGVPVNQPPEADFAISQTGLDVTVDATGSSDSDGSIASYAWDWGDGHTSTGLTSSYTYGAPGTYSIELTVTDNLGATDTLTKNVTAGIPITHGEQLTMSMTGYAGLGLLASDISSTATPGRGYFRADTPLEFTPNQPYVYDNNPSNKGGIVPAGGLTIDGIDVAAGTYVVQFQEFSSDFYMTASNSFVFRGCKMRWGNRAPGFWNTTAGWTGKMYVGYCDLGGTSALDADYNEVGVRITSGAGGAIYRNYISYTATGIQLNTHNYDLTENYIEKVSYYYGPNPPPGESTDKHLNGITLNGGENCVRILRNNIVIANPDEAGRIINQTDCISFFQDFGDFPGTGQNSDGTYGYRVLDNYVGGTGYCFYAGMNPGFPTTSVQNMHLAGNKVTTSVYPNGGANGAIAAVPVWGSYGNTKTNNTWADGPNAGTDAF